MKANLRRAYSAFSEDVLEGEGLLCCAGAVLCVWTPRTTTTKQTTPSTPTTHPLLPLLQGCAKQAEFRAVVFALCYFHAALLERKKFGVGNLPGSASGLGWNMAYPFNTGDLLCCGQCASNYLDANAKVRVCRGGGVRA